MFSVLPLCDYERSSRGLFKCCLGYSTTLFRPLYKVGEEKREISKHRELPKIRPGRRCRGVNVGQDASLDVNKFTVTDANSDVTNSSHNENFYSCFYTNCDSYLNKRSELKALLEIHDPDIVALTEVKPKRVRYTVQESEITLEGYEYEPPFHNLDKQGRGIALYMNQH